MRVTMGDSKTREDDMYKKVLVTTDGSELAKAAIPHAARLAEGTDRTYT